MKIIQNYRKVTEKALSLGNSLKNVIVKEIVKQFNKERNC